MEDEKIERIMEYLETQYSMGQPCHNYIEKSLMELEKLGYSREVVEYWRKVRFGCLPKEMRDLISEVESCKSCSLDYVRMSYGVRKLVGAGATEDVKIMFIVQSPTPRNLTICPNYDGEQAIFYQPPSFKLWRILATVGLLDKDKVQEIENMSLPEKAENVCQNKDSLEKVKLRAKKLNTLLREAGIYITDAVKCTTPRKRDVEYKTPRFNEIRSCRRHLLKQIEIIKPKVICTLGRTALRAILDDKRARMKDWRLRRWRINGIEVLALPLLRGTSDQELLNGFKKLKELLEAYH